MKKTISLLLAGFGLATTMANAADLMSVYRDASVYDAQFAAARASLDAGREKLTQGRSGLLPTIGVSANTTWNDTEVTPRTSPTMTYANQYNSNGWTASLTQPLFRWQNWAAYKQGELAAAIAETQFSAAQQDLIVRTAQAYFDVLLAQETVATAAAQKTAITHQLESAKRNFEVGTATITDTHEAQARFDLAVAAELAAQNDLTVKRQALQVLIGKEPDTLKVLKAGAQIGRPQPDDMMKWAETAETGNLSVMQAQAAKEIADQEVGKQRAGHLPTLDIVATYGKSGTGYYAATGTGVDTKATTVGLQLSVPLFAGGAIMSKDREAVALREKARADLDNARRQAALSARQAYLGVTSGLSQVRAYEAAVASSRSALESNQVGYDVGVRINIDVLNAQSQLYDTRQKLTKARFDTLIAQLKLKQAAGNLTEDDLVAINALLE
ncbi:MAG: TolC family outer membrane protein [Gammaproteobacteria bacterium]|nr:TolC family outer membrane protein [Gammaproteobacteria bacterium]MBU1416202.1 TolC family outer membrane protein [Gammaproteobacteria bacterium]